MIDNRDVFASTGLSAFGIPVRVSIIISCGASQ